MCARTQPDPTYAQYRCVCKRASHACNWQPQQSKTAQHKHCRQLGAEQNRVPWQRAMQVPRDPLNYSTSQLAAARLGQGMCRSHIAAELKSHLQVSVHPSDYPHTPPSNTPTMPGTFESPQTSHRTTIRGQHHLTRMAQTAPLLSPRQRTSTAQDNASTTTFLDNPEEAQ